MIQAEEFTRRHPDEAQRFVAKRFEFDMPFVQSIWAKNDLIVQLPQSLLLSMEMYIRDHLEAEFSHGMCPECAEKAYKELEALKKRTKE